MRIKVMEMEDCKYFKKYSMCSRTGKRCTYKAKFDYDKQDFEIWCSEFKNLKDMEG